VVACLTVLDRLARQHGDVLLEDTDTKHALTTRILDRVLGGRVKAIGTGAAIRSCAARHH
jgi:hypothetical protein